MMRICLKIVLFLLLPVISYAQSSLLDSLRNIFFGAAHNDSIIYETGNKLYDYYEEVNRDSAYFYADHCVQISRRNNRKLNEAHILSRKAYQELNLGRYAESLQSLLASFALSENKTNDKNYWNVGTLRAEKEKRLYALNCAHHIYGILMRETMNGEEAIIHFKKAKRIAVAINSNPRSMLASLNLGRIYMETGQFDSALHYENDALSVIKSFVSKKYLSTILYYTGKIYLMKGDTGRGAQYFHQSVRSAITQNNTDALTRSYHGLAISYFNSIQKDSIVYYAAKSLETMRKLGKVAQIEYNLGDAYEGLYHAYELSGQHDSAFKYLALAQVTNDSIYQRRIKSLAEFQKLNLDEQQRLQLIQQERVAYQNKVRTYFLLAGIGVLLLFAVIFYRNTRQKQKAKVKIEQAYDNLKATQQQLIQSEKMASLGELTAGIAHEIQNPLNFVNNFSDVNQELVDELKTELVTGNTQSAIEIADNIKENEQKINHHGKRAEAIVKGMLQHSRKSSGHKEPTSLNALADEYLRLAYHGLKAKDRSFNTTIKTAFDESIGNINIIPQDIGRVILNLINNAFYAVDEKKKLNGDSYEPIISVSTKKIAECVLLCVNDNGNGISQKVVDKIFQPFFTTKPTGEGTGLGLSLAYDIVKAHGGEIKVKTKEEGTEFTIQLPIS